MFGHFNLRLTRAERQEFFPLVDPPDLGIRYNMVGFLRNKDRINPPPGLVQLTLTRFQRSVIGIRIGSALPGKLSGCSRINQP